MADTKAPDSNASVTPGDVTEISKAVTVLAHRISALEEQDTGNQTEVNVTKDLWPGMKRTLADLKALRTALVTAISDLDERLSELDAVKSENQKLKYRVKHLLRSLEAEEK